MARVHRPFCAQSIETAASRVLQRLLFACGVWPQGTNEVLPGASRAVASLVDKMAPALMRTPAASATTVGFAALAPSALVGALIALLALAWMSMLM